MHTLVTNDTTMSSPNFPRCFMSNLLSLLSAGCQSFNVFCSPKTRSPRLRCAHAALGLALVLASGLLAPLGSRAQEPVTVQVRLQPYVWNGIPPTLVLFDDNTRVVREWEDYWLSVCCPFDVIPGRRYTLWVLCHPTNPSSVSCTVEDDPCLRVKCERISDDQWIDFWRQASWPDPWWLWVHGIEVYETYAIEVEPAVKPEVSAPSVDGAYVLQADDESQMRVFLANSDLSAGSIRWEITQGEGLVTPIPSDDTLSFTLKAGSEEGSVVVQATDTASGCSGTIQIELKKCTPDGCASCSDAASTTLASVDVRIPLGWSRMGSSAGALSIHEDSPSAQLATPQALHYKSIRPDVDVVKDAQGVLRQVKSAEFLADIVSVTSAKYCVNLYPSTRVQAKSKITGLYSFTGDPVAVVAIESPNGNVNALRVTQTRNGAETVADYQWLGAGWQLVTGGGLRQASKTIAWSADHTDRTETTILRDSDGTAVQQRVRTYRQYPTGEHLIQDTIGTGANARTDTYIYLDTGYLQQALHADGSWQWYLYDAQNRPVSVYSSFLNQAPTTDPSLCRLTEYTYTVDVVSGSGDDGRRDPGAPRRTIEYVKGQEVSRSYAVLLQNERREIRCVAPAAAWDDPANLVTITRTCSTGTHRDEVASILHPDGTMQMHLYGDPSPNTTNVTLSGHPNSTGTDVDDGTRSTTILGPYGQLLSESVVDIASGITVSSNAYAYDDQKRLTHTLFMDGAVEQNFYGCCTLDSRQERDGSLTQYTYDALKRQVTTTYNGITTSNVLDAVGRVLATVRIGTDGSAITTSTSAYNDAGDLVSSTDALGHTTQYAKSLDSIGQTVRQTTYPDLSTRIETYAKDGSLLSVAGTAVHPVRYEYGAELDNDIPSQFTKTIPLLTDGSDSQEWTKTCTDIAGRSYKTVSVDGSANRTYFDLQGRQNKTVDADGVTQLFQYNSKGEIEYSAIDMDRDGQIDFDGADRITRTTNDFVASHGTFVRRSRTFQWAVTGQDRSQLASLTEQEVNGLRSWSVSYGLTNFTQTEYLGNGLRRATQVAPDGSQVISINLNGRLTSVTTLDNSGAQLAQTTYGYDTQGRQSTVTDTRCGTSTTAFTDADQVQSITTPPPSSGQDAQVTSTFYDVMGRAWKTTQPDGASVTNEFYTTGELKKTFGSRTYPVEYTYDYAGRMKTMKTWQDFAGDTGAAITTWNYDSRRGFLVSKQYADGKGPAYTHTSGGRLLTRTWARGITTTYGYDNAGVLASVNYSDTATPAVSYSFDRRGRLTQVTDSGTRTLGYNDAGLTLSDNYWVSGLSFGSQLEYGYDSLLRRTNLANVSLGSTVRYTYDAASRLQTVSDGVNSAGYSYIANSPLVGQISFTSNGASRMTTTKQYDYLNRMTRIGAAGPGSSSLPSFDYVYNSANQRTAVTQADNARWVYQYDALGQVTSGKKYWADGTPVAGQQFEYTFDDIGNRRTNAVGGDESGANLRYASYAANALNQYSSRTVPGFVEVQGAADASAAVTVNSQAAYRKGDYYRVELAVNNANAVAYEDISSQGVLNTDTVTLPRHALVAATPESFAYDDDGNLLSDGKWSYTWDGENRLVSMESLSAIPAEAKRRLEFAYDQQWRRIYKKLLVWNSSSSAYQMATEERYWYDGWNLIGRADLATGRVQTYAWGLDLSGSIQGAGGVGGLLFVGDRTSAAGYYAPAYDGNGNVMALVSLADGTLSAQYEYGPFGELLRATGPIAKANPFRFSTKYQDGETELLYYGYRYYGASAGKWLSSDPIGGRGGPTAYGFVIGNPLGFIDPLGLNLYAIDGTGNDETAQSNVLKFSNRYRAGTGTRYYYRGPGNPTDGKLGGGPFGRGSSGIVDAVMSQICADYRADRSVKIDIIGFSRGAAIANEVAWELQKHGCKCRYSGPGWTWTGYIKEHPQVRFLGLFDPVYSFPRIVAWAWHDEQIAGNVNTASIAYASDEVRLLFRHSILSTSSSQTRMNWQDFPGRHSDVGGHVDNNHAIGLTTLKYMVDQAVAAGVDMDTSGLPSQERIRGWEGTPMLDPGPEEPWTGILNTDWTINWTVLQTSPWR